MHRFKVLLVTALAALSMAGEVGLTDGLTDELVVPLRGVDPAAASLSTDLDVLAGWLGDARVVGLGERWHGVHDFRRLAHRIFAHLVRSRGFNVFALEISQAHARRLNDFVHGRRDDLDALLAEHWWVARVWYDRALRELLIWMRRHNETAEHPIHIAGFDFKQPSFAMAAVVDGLRRLDPELAVEAERRYSKISNLGGLGVFPNVYGFTGSLRIPLPRRTGAKTLGVRLKVKARGVSHGWVGLSVEGVEPLAGDALDSRYLSPDKLSELWTPLDIDVELADSIDAIELAIFHRGNGTVWFDGLALTLDGQPLPEVELEKIQERELAMPLIQVMDYRPSFDDHVSYAGGKSLRVDRDSALDESLTAAMEVDALVERELARATDRVPSSESDWLRQMSRLVVQATQWRTLVENNRDVFLGENVVWLERRGFPQSRVLVLAHSSHTNRRARGRSMGLVLAEEYGDDYKTVTMLALSGEYRRHGDPKTLAEGAGLELFSLTAEPPGPLEQTLARLGSGDLLFHLRAGAAAETSGRRLDLESLPVADIADVAILLRRVRPSLPP